MLNIITQKPPVILIIIFFLIVSCKKDEILKSPPLTEETENWPVGFKWLLRTPGSTITVKFIEKYDPAVQLIIEQSAHEWEKYANIKFSFVPLNKAAEIGIKLNQGGGSYYNPFQNTTSQLSHNMEIDLEDKRGGWVSQIALHEFGHVLGFVHEHQHPDAVNIINEEAFILHLVKTSGHSKESAKDAVKRYDRKYFELFPKQFFPYDYKSIMHYPVPASCTYDGKEILHNRMLSEKDKERARILYPW